MTDRPRDTDAPAPSRRSDLRAAALALAVAAALAFPPEVHPECGPIVALLLAAAALTLRAPKAASIAAGLALAGFNLAVSLAPGRTIDTLARLALPAGAFLAARELEPRRRGLVLGSAAAVGAALGVLAVAQRLFLLPREALAARAAQAAPEVVARLASGRAFGTHLVPAALGGALVVALAALGAWRARAARAATAALAVPIVAGLLATASVGAFAGLAAGAAFAAVRRAVRPRRLAAGAGALLLLLLGLVALRPGSLGDLDRPDHPLRLRAGNWRGAVLVGLRRPLVGAGLGGFGALYPRVRRPDDSETVYAHNSWLQLAVEGGLPAAALLGAAAFALFRRRRSAAGPERWALAGTAAFAAHNLVDFTFYLPGVAVPAAVLAGMAFPAGAPAERAARSRSGRWVLAAALLAAAFLWTGTALARRALEAAQADPAAALGTGAAPWSPRLAVRAARRLAAVSPAAARALALRARRWDPAAPGPEHLLGDLALAEGAPARAWRHHRAALARHPADPDLAEKVEAEEKALAEAGLGEAPVALPQPEGPVRWPWSSWDDLLLGIHLLAAFFVLVRWRRGGPAPPEALALALALALSAWGEGGALPGARCGRQILLAAGAFAWLARGRARGAPSGRAFALGGSLWLWVAVAASFAPDRSAARDGLAAWIGAGLALVLSASLAGRFERWPRLLAALAPIAAAGPALLYAAQRVAEFAGFALDRAPVPFRVWASRPAADFLHPGHLGTFLVACGLPLLASAGGGRRGRAAGTAGVLLLLAGASTASRATLFLALPAGAAVLLAALGARRVRLAVAGAAVLGAAAGVPFLLARFRAGDPFAVARLSIWPAALKALADAPWFGFGPGGFRSIAPAYAFPVDGSLVRYAKVFRGPHSDPLGLALAGGLPALLLAGVLAGCLLPRIWRAARRAPAQAGLLAGLAALAAHGLADDFLAERPAAALLAALFAGALIGSDRPRSEPRRPLRLAAALALAVWLGAGELRPYAADRALRAGDAELAAALDPLRDDAWLAALGSGGGGSLDRTASALEAARRAIAANRALPAAWRARALVLDASCRGPLAERITCEDALAAWGASLARLPRDVTARRGRARLEAALGRRGEAAADLALALVWEPAYLGARADLARLYEEAGQVEAAREEMAALEEAARVARGIVPASPYERAVLAPPEPPALRTGEPAGPERLTAPGRRP